ncbi:hypothetical protein ACFVSX_20595 [Streptomyces rubiginosohelvolus]|uniref:hypothetical protein n=1 Tax=Streptomyces rubiginosohelvolus TaxID=67362 RepID=UPI0036DF98E4
MTEALNQEARDTDPVLPAARGVVFEAVLSSLRDRHEPRVSSRAAAWTEPYGDDLQDEAMGPLPAAEPGLDVEVAFGIHATGLPEVRLAEFLPTVRHGGGSVPRIPLATSVPLH